MTRNSPEKYPSKEASPVENNLFQTTNQYHPRPPSVGQKYLNPDQNICLVHCHIILNLSPFVEIKFSTSETSIINFPLQSPQLQITTLKFSPQKKIFTDKLPYVLFLFNPLITVSINLYLRTTDQLGTPFTNFFPMKTHSSLPLYQISRGLLTNIYQRLVYVIFSGPTNISIILIISYSTHIWMPRYLHFPSAKMMILQSSTQEIIPPRRTLINPRPQSPHVF